MTTTTTTTETPRVYVGTYHKYNSGSIAGKWLDLDDYSDAKEFYDACSKLHSDESDPEFMFQDWENIPSEMVGESYIDPKFWDLIELDEDKRLIVETLIENNVCSDLDDAIERIDDTIVYKDDDDIVNGWLKGIEVPECLTGYIDESAILRDIKTNGTYLDMENGNILCVCW